jgi:GxxExxY protein
MSEIIFKNESYKIIGVCLEVYNTLGMGFDEAVYKDAIEIEFKKLNIDYIREKEFDVFYKGIPLNRKFYVDFFVYNKINLEVKSKSSLQEAHILQTKNYCACAKTKLGILVNFGATSLEYKRILI